MHSAWPLLPAVAALLVAAADFACHYDRLSPLHLRVTKKCCASVWIAYYLALAVRAGTDGQVPTATTCSIITVASWLAASRAAPLPRWRFEQRCRGAHRRD